MCLIEVKGLARCSEGSVEVITAAYYETIEITLTGTGWDEVTADDVLLHALKVVALAHDSCLIEDTGGLLEGSG